MIKSKGLKKKRHSQRLGHVTNMSKWWLNSWQNAAHVAKVGSKEILKVLCTPSKNLELFCKHSGLAIITTDQQFTSNWGAEDVYVKFVIVCILCILIPSKTAVDPHKWLMLCGWGMGKNITVLSDTSFSRFERFSGVSVMLTTQTETCGEMTQNFWNSPETDLTHSWNFQLDRKDILYIFTVDMHWWGK